MPAYDDPPDVDRLAQSMLAMLGEHDGHDEAPPKPLARRGESLAKAPAFADNPRRVEAVREATRADRDRYLNSGLQPVDCRFCHVTVNVKKLGPGHTSVQWNTEASQRCAHFAEQRAAGVHSARSRACPKLTDSIQHAVAEGCLDEFCTAPSPGDG